MYECLSLSQHFIPISSILPSSSDLHWYNLSRTRSVIGTVSVHLSSIQPNDTRGPHHSRFSSRCSGNGSDNGNGSELCWNNRAFLRYCSMIHIGTKKLRAMQPTSSSHSWVNSQQKEEEQRDEQILLDAATSQQWSEEISADLPWDNGNNNSIWSNQSTQQRMGNDSTSIASTNQSSLGSIGESIRLPVDDSIITSSFSQMSLNRQVTMQNHRQTVPRRDEPLYHYEPSTSLQRAQSYHQHPKIPSSPSTSYASGAGSVPGIAPTFSGSTSGPQSQSNSYSSKQYPTQQQSSLSIAASCGPPPGFLSPIQTSKSIASQRNQKHENSEQNNQGGSHFSRQRPAKGGRRQTGQGRGRGRRNESDNDKVPLDDDSKVSSRALQLLMKPTQNDEPSYYPSVTSTASTPVMSGSIATERSYLAKREDEGENDDDDNDSDSPLSIPIPLNAKKDWLLRMNRRLHDIPIGELDPTTVPLSAIMNAWAKTKSSQGASMVELWLNRAQQEYDAGNRKVVPTSKMYTMAGASRCERILDLAS